MSLTQLTISISTMTGDAGTVDNVSLKTSAGGPELVVNGDFEALPWFPGDESNPPLPSGWYGGAAASSLDGSAAARIDLAVSEELAQDILAGSVVPGVEYTLSIRSRDRVLVRLIADYDSDGQNRLAPLGWSPLTPTLLGGSSAVLFNNNNSETASFEATFTIPASVLTEDPGLPPADLFVDTSAQFVPGGEGATLAIAGLAVAGLSRAGFYPKQTDDIVAPPADPPVFDGGIYAYHKDEEGKE